MNKQINSDSDNNINQHLTNNDVKEILEKLGMMKNLIINSQEESDTKRDALLTIETLKNELRKKNPIFSIIKEALFSLANIATVSSYAQSILHFYPFNYSMKNVLT